MRKSFETFRLPLALVALAVLVVGLGVGAWFVRPHKVMDEASAALESDETIEASEFKLDSAEGILLKPLGGRKNVSVIFYPGARVPPEAYAPSAIEIAREGFEVYLVEMPLNLAVLGWEKAAKIISSRDRVQNWVMAGHSMGGAMAARFVSKTNYPVSGLVLWAAYPPEGARFSTNLDVLTITGEKDEIISEENLERAREQLPRPAEFVEIEGGNHSQFGWYGFQADDGQATISRREQTKLVSRLTMDFLNKF